MIMESSAVRMDVMQRPGKIAQKRQPFLDYTDSCFSPCADTSRALGIVEARPKDSFMALSKSIACLNGVGFVDTQVLVVKSSYLLAWRNILRRRSCNM